jgi:16S rRNA (guanine966-N2)-methyltransferase
MRIIAGSKKGMRLHEPEGLVSRPILDRVKESLFNILYSRGLPEGAVVADLFSGVGSLGLEALSRGAASATFAEMDSGIVAILQQNIEKAGFTAQARVVRASAFGAGALAPAGGPKYNLVFVDPPYAATQDVGEASSLAGLLRLLSGQTSEDVLVVVRTERKITLLDSYTGFSVTDRREYGKMALTFLQRSQNTEHRTQNTEAAGGDAEC